MSKIQTVQQLRDEIIRVKQESDFRKAAIRTSFEGLKRSLTPLNLIISILGELKQETLFNSAITAFEKIRDYFRKK